MVARDDLKLDVRSYMFLTAMVNRDSSKARIVVSQYSKLTVGLADIIVSTGTELAVARLQYEYSILQRR